MTDLAELDTVEQTDMREFTNGLRTLADLLDRAGVVEPYDTYRHHIYVNTRDEMLEVCRRIGGRWGKDEDPGDYFGMTRLLGGGVEIYVYAGRDQVCESVVVGTRTVQRVDPEAPKIEVQEDVVEWRCPPSILGLAQA